jgi:TonB family protein
VRRQGQVEEATSGPGRPAVGGRLARLAALVFLAACAAEDAVVEHPRLLDQEESPFRYPAELWDDGIDGETVVMVRVNTAGVVDSVYVYESSGQPAFDSAAVDGARDLWFAPGRRGAREATMWARVPVRFWMNEAGPSAGTSP